MTGKCQASILVLLAVLFALAVYSAIWLGVRWPHPWAEDYLIYYRAFRAAQAGASAYFPYNIGGSFVYHPFALSLTWLLALFGLAGELPASVIWAAANVAAYVGAVLLSTRLALNTPGESPPGPQWWKKPALLAALWLVFAPFWEMVYIGQINGLVIFSLLLALDLGEQGQDMLAGLPLAVAILLKTSPVIFLGYFLFTRRWRTVLSALGTILLLSGATYLQFGPGVYVDFLAVLGELGGETHAVFFNHSLPGTIIRLALHAGRDIPGEAIVGWHQLIMAGLTGLVLLSTLLIPRGDRGARPRRSAFGLLLTLMTVTSPLVWYHHNVFLILPLTLLLTDDRRPWRVTGLALLLVLQAERLYERLAEPLSEIYAYAGLPVIVAQFVLLAAGGVIYGRSLALARRADAHLPPG